MGTDECPASGILVVAAHLHVDQQAERSQRQVVHRVALPRVSTTHHRFERYRWGTPRVRLVVATGPVRRVLDHTVRVLQRFSSHLRRRLLDLGTDRHRHRRVHPCAYSQHE
ncbi:Uncharacterised protein [Chlamydia trachomatis]|nr:Uncharacterised protein [Chlamydia trachomatis]